MYYYRGLSEWEKGYLTDTGLLSTIHNKINNKIYETAGRILLKYNHISKPRTFIQKDGRLKNSGKVERYKKKSVNVRRIPIH